MQFKKNDLVEVEVEVPVFDSKGNVSSYQPIPAQYEIKDYQTGPAGEKIILERRTPREMIDSSIPNIIEIIKGANGNVTNDIGTFDDGVKHDVHTKITANISDPSKN